MSRTILFAVLPAAAAAILCAQAPAPSPSFEVASIKPANPQPMGRIMVRMSGGPGTDDPSQITYENVSLRDVIKTAYGVKNFQITGPDWMETQRFDIVAKVPKGVTAKEDLKPMLQNLLKERFGLAVHRESKDMQMYALVVGKHGSKLKESVDQPADPNDPPEGGRGPGIDALPKGPDGMPKLPKGRQGMMAQMSPKGLRLVATKQPIAGLIEMLGNQLQHPVTDETGLKGAYDFTLEFMPDEGSRMGPMGGMHMPPPGAGPGGSAPTSEAPTGPSLYAALDEQLGLKLEPKKGAVDMLIVDRIEKMPTEN